MILRIPESATIDDEFFFGSGPECGSALYAFGVSVFYPVPIMKSGIEIEAKWQADAGEHERVRKALRRAGASHIDTVRESNVLFDTPDQTLRLAGQVLRVRGLDDGRSLLTFKGPATYSEGIKTREEPELYLTDGDAMIAILNSLEFRVTLEYAKTRESWDCNGALVALDTLEFGRFVEIEGTEDQVRSTADLLAFDMARAERRGYPSMMRAHQAGERLE